MYLSDRPRQKPEPGAEVSGRPSVPADPAAPASGRAPSLRRRVSTTVVLLGLVSLFTDISSESLSAVLPLYLTAVLGLSPLAYGFVDGLYQGVSALVRILGGWLSDRADRPKWVAFAGYGLSALTKALLIPAQGLAAVTTVITLDRLGKGLRTAPRDALIATATPQESLGRAFGVHRALDTTGAAIGPLLAFTILWAVPGDYRAVFVASLGAALFGLALLGLMVPDLRPRRAAGRDRTAVPRPSWRTLTDPRFGRLVAAAALLGLLTISDGFLYLSLQQRDEFAGTWFPLLFVGTNVVYLALAIPLGRLSDRLGRARVLVAGHLLLVGAYVCAALPTGGVGLTLATLGLLGAFYAATDGVLAALVSALVPAPVRASGLATAQTVQALARFASSLLFGLLWTTLGRSTAVVTVAVALTLAVGVAGLLLRRVEQSTPSGVAAVS